MLRYLRGGSKRLKLVWWILIVVTVVTFVFFFGTPDPTQLGSTPNVVGQVNGEPILREEYLAAVEEQRIQFRTRYGVDAADRDLKGVEAQAWRNLVARRLFEKQAEREGITVAPREIVIAMQTAPPAVITAAPAFQTDGKFDVQKYAAALRDPANDWTPVETMIRQQLPVRKLQERLIASVKLAEPELLQAFRDRYERIAATVVFVPGIADTGDKPPTDADLQRVYEKYKTRFATSARTQLEMLVVPKAISQAEVAVAREAAQGFANRARAGEDWNTLVRDYSELQTGKEGGEVDRVFQPMEFGAEAPKVAAMKEGDISDPIRDNTRFIVFKLLKREPPGPQAPMGGVRIGQLVVRIRADGDTLQQQFMDLIELRKRAQSKGLGAAAAEKGLATTTSEYYNAANPPQALFDVPQAADWGLGARVGAVSPVFEGVDEFAIVAVKVQQPAGLVPRDRVGETLRQIAAVDARVERARPVADAIAAAVGAGQTLEQAAAAAGHTAMRVENITRRQPDPRVAAAPEFVGALFGAAEGGRVGPFRGLNGWYFGRLEAKAPADTALYSQVKGQIANEILQQRQQNFFNEYVATLRSKADVKDLRASGQR